MKRGCCSKFTPEVACDVWVFVDIACGYTYRGNRVTKGTNTVSRSYPAFIESVNVGDRIGIMVDGSGQLSFYLNGTSLGAASPGLPTGTPLRKLTINLPLLVSSWRSCVDRCL